MTAKKKAKELLNKFNLPSGLMSFERKECALIAVDEIINSNPHSNPFNTEVSSTMDFWLEVKNELEKL